MDTANLATRQGMDPTTIFSHRLSAPVMKEYVLTEKLGSGTFAIVYKAYRKVPPRL